MMDGTGRFKTRGREGAIHTVWVTDRSIAFDISEDMYRWRGYAPPFDELPWKHELPHRPMASPTRR